MRRLVIGTGLGTGTASSRTGVCQALWLALHKRVDRHRPVISVVASGGSESVLRLVIGTGLGTGTASSSRTGVCQALWLALHKRVDRHRPAISMWWRPAGRGPCCVW